jgi:hypothetical protein
VRARLSSDVLGPVAVMLPEALTLKPMIVDAETRGDLTRGMSGSMRWGRPRSRTSRWRLMWTCRRALHPPHLERTGEVGQALSTAY